MLFGVPMFASGMKRYPVQNRPRIIQYAVTLILKEHDQEFITSLHRKLQKIYPLYQQEYEQKEQDTSSVIYIYYPEEFNLIELVPFSISMTIVFVYVYFSIRKVEMIRSRIVVALAAVVTVLGSLVMSLGFCFFFGISIWSQSSSSMGVYPYLLILVGLENCLVLTKSVMTTENNLDTKIRVAQGLSREGWPITKNLMTEITILTAGLVLTFLPLLQEFCIFAIVGLVSDYFLQMMLFSTVLGLNVKRVEVLAEVRKLPRYLEQHKWQHQNHRSSEKNSLIRSRSHPGQLSDLDKEVSMTKAQEKKIPKRLRIVNFWARTRFFQRGFMIWMVLWISNIIYSSGIIESIFLINNESNNSTHQNGDLRAETVENLNNYENMVKNLSSFMPDFYTKNIQKFSEEQNVTEKIQKLKYNSQFEIGNKLSSFHWASIFKQYNISMIGRFVTILPSMKFSHVVPVEVALKIKNHNDLTPSSSKWNTLTSALDPLDLNDADIEDDLLDLDPIENQPLYPKTPTEMVLLFILCGVSVFFIAYTIVVMYRCICSRNYAEWRASRWDEDGIVEMNSEQVLEGFPIQVKGHRYNVECVVTDGNLIASSCLQGLIKIWDSSNGDLVAEINRVAYFEQLQKYNIERGEIIGSTENIKEHQISLSTSPTSSTTINSDEKNNDEIIKNQLRLKTSLKFDFKSLKMTKSNEDIKNEFQRQFDKYFEPVRISKTNVDNEYLTTDNNNLKLHNGSCSSESLSSNNSLTKANNNSNASPIWSLDFIDNLVAIGCADGRIEFWEGTTGSFKCIYQNETTIGNGVTHMKLASDKVIAARLSGRIDFLRLETYTQGRHIDWNFTSTYRRTHARTSSAGSINNGMLNNQNHNRQYQRNSLNLTHPNNHSNLSSSPTQEEIRCILELQHPGHTQPLQCLDVLGNILFTGSQDHTLKVFHTDTNSLFYTLHGHCAPVTSLLVDQFQSGIGCSGSQDGLLCVWDLITGKIVHFHLI
jgi:hypothetical protein